MASLQREQDRCRVCGSERLYEFLDLGEMPLTNAFLESADREAEWFPLEVVYCVSCTHVQLKHTVDRSHLFSEYPYQSSASDSIPAHFTEYVEEVRSRFLSPGDRVIEIGSNDGTLLRTFDEDVDVIGIDPAMNIASFAREKGVETVTELFDSRTASDVRQEFGTASVMIANNVLGHVDDLYDFMSGVDHLLETDGTFIIEVPYLLDLLDKVEFDTIFHEHISYFSITSLQRLVEQFGMCISDVKQVDTHGGSIRAYVRYESQCAVSKSVKSLGLLENARGVDEPKTFDQFARAVRQRATHIRELIEHVAESGYSIVGYGAPSKANILLNYAEVDAGHIDYVIDTTPMKQGTFMPGTKIPVREPRVFHENPPDYALLLAWNYRETILEKEVEFRERGGHFLVPTPHVHVF